MTTEEVVASTRPGAETGRKFSRARLRILWRRLRGGSLSPVRASASVALGLFIGSLPIYGLHLPLCLLLCLPLRLDVVVAYVAANISNPLFAPFLLTAEVEVGSLILTGNTVPFDVERARNTGVTGFAFQAALGSVVVGAGLALLGGVVAWTVSSRSARRQPSPELEAMARTLARYSGAPPAARWYVASKLHTDPVVRSLSALPGQLGRVLDAGCGRGQIGLFLLELGRAEKLLGCDWDERKLDVARRAAGAGACFEQADLRTLDWPAVDSVLLIDVLHYFSRSEQDAILARAAQAIVPGGRLIVREADAALGWRSSLTQLFERIAVYVRYNRAGKLEFRPAAELVEQLRSLGLSAELEANETGRALANVLIVGQKPKQQPKP